MVALTGIKSVGYRFRQYRLDLALAAVAHHCAFERDDERTARIKCRPAACSPGCTC